MNHLNAITTHSQHLPDYLQKQVLDFVGYLEACYPFAIEKTTKYRINRF